MAYFNIPHTTVRRLAVYDISLPQYSPYIPTRCDDDDANVNVNSILFIECRQTNHLHCTDCFDKDGNGNNPSTE